MRGVISINTVAYSGIGSTIAWVKISGVASPILVSIARYDRKNGAVRYEALWSNGTQDFVGVGDERVDACADLANEIYGEEQN